MSEMLGNRYFLSRKFDKAIPEFEQALLENKNDQKIKKKLVICYVQVGRLQQALDYFLQIIEIDPFIIIDTDPYYDDCPCPTLVDQWQKVIAYKQDSVKMEYVALGILYLYCDIQKSISYFVKARDAMKMDAQIVRILLILNKVSTKTGQPS